VKLIEPDWPAPAGVVALSTTRHGGCSTGIYEGLNTGDHVGDEAGAVTANRGMLIAELTPGTRVMWLSQVHGNRVVQAQPAVVDARADASWTRDTSLACAILTADCLPVLFCDRAGTVVAAAHAGWRGLCNGVLEATVASMGVEAGEVLAWLGPAIGKAAFEVGPEVRSSFLAVAGSTSAAAIEACFTPHPGNPGRYLASLCLLARQRLSAVGIKAVYGTEHCTFSDSENFYSYRRDGQTGRMTSLIYLNTP
jgi:purine-nucleoside/S-methyl-5'-thioadenosine phosphorylase / adenosine deaminase